MNYIHNHDDYATEPVRGLPATLPRGEFVLWQGAPTWRAFARQVFKTRIIAGLLLAGAAARIGFSLSAGSTLGIALGEAGIIVGFGLAGLAILCLLAWLVQKTTVYTITNKRIVMRIGVAIQKTFNVPFAAIDGAALRQFSDGTGSLSAMLKPGVSIAYLIMWPHVRPWKLGSTQPTLRSIPDAHNVARLLTDAYTSHVQADEALQRSGLVAQAQDADAAPAQIEETDTTAPDPRKTDPHYIPKPLVLMAASLALITVIAVGVAQLAGLSTDQRPADAEILLSQDISFIALPGSQISVTNSDTGEQLTLLRAGTDGLLRSAVRGLEGSRVSGGLDVAAPYQLQLFEGDGVYLSDALTGRSIRLESFGPIETGATADLLRLGRTGSVAAQ